MTPKLQLFSLLVIVLLINQSQVQARSARHDKVTRAAAVAAPNPTDNLNDEPASSSSKPPTAKNSAKSKDNNSGTPNNDETKVGNPFEGVGETMSNAYGKIKDGFKSAVDKVNSTIYPKLYPESSGRSTGEIQAVDGEIPYIIMPMDGDEESDAPADKEKAQSTDDKMNEFMKMMNGGKVVSGAGQKVPSNVESLRNTMDEFQKSLSKSLMLNEGRTISLKAGNNQDLILGVSPNMELSNNETVKSPDSTQPKEKSEDSPSNAKESKSAASNANGAEKGQENRSHHKQHHQGHQKYDYPGVPPAYANYYPVHQGGYGYYPPKPMHGHSHVHGHGHGTGYKYTYHGHGHGYYSPRFSDSGSAMDNASPVSGVDYNNPGQYLTYNPYQQVYRYPSSYASQPASYPMVKRSPVDEPAQAEPDRSLQPSDSADVDAKETTKSKRGSSQPGDSIWENVGGAWQLAKSTPQMVPNLQASAQAGSTNVWDSMGGALQSLTKTASQVAVPNADKKVKASELMESGGKILGQAFDSISKFPQVLQIPSDPNSKIYLSIKQDDLVGASLEGLKEEISHQQFVNNNPVGSVLHSATHFVKHLENSDKENPVDPDVLIGSARDIASSLLGVAMNTKEDGTHYIPGLTDESGTVYRPAITMLGRVLSTAVKAGSYDSGMIEKRDMYHQPYAQSVVPLGTLYRYPAPASDQNQESGYQQAQGPLYLYQ